MQKQAAAIYLQEQNHLVVVLNTIAAVFIRIDR